MLCLNMHKGHAYLFSALFVRFLTVTILFSQEFIFKTDLFNHILTNKQNAWRKQAITE